MKITGPNAAEAEAWATNGLSWIENEAAQDRLLAPVTEALLGVSDFRAGEAVLDIGCGTGAHALAVAERVAPGGRVLALDVSAPFLERVRVRADEAGLPVDTFHGDAQIARVPKVFDAATSRFGVMFFSDPGAAFANIARAVKPGGRMIFAAWGSEAVNPFWRLPRSVASRHLGPLPATPANGPGPMGLAERDFVLAEFAKAGLDQISVTPQEVTLGQDGDARSMASRSVRIGAAARILRAQGGTEADRRAIEDDLTEAYRAYEDDGRLALPAILNIIHARVP